MTGTRSFSDGTIEARALLPGIAVAAILALSGQFIPDHRMAPPLLLALLFGISLCAFRDHPDRVSGIASGATTRQRGGVVLPGLEISFRMIGALAWPAVTFMAAILPGFLAFGPTTSRSLSVLSRPAAVSAEAIAMRRAFAAVGLKAELADIPKLGRPSGARPVASTVLPAGLVAMALTTLPLVPT